MQQLSSKGCFSKRKGISKPFRNLASSYKTKDETYQEVKPALMSSSQTQIHSKFSIVSEASQKEKVVYNYLKLIIFKNDPILIVEANLHRELPNVI